MINQVDYFLNRITMYRLVLYLLIILIFLGMIAGLLGFIPYSPLNLLLSSVFTLVMCWATNKLFSTVYNASTNTESVYITALILALIPHNPAR